MEDKKVVRRPHAIMLAAPFQGHINPFIALAINLASKGFVITFVHLEHVHHQISRSHQDGSNSGVKFDIFSEARNAGLDIRYATISDCYPLEYNRGANPEYFEYMLNEFPALVDEFVGNLLTEESSSLPNPPMAPFILADTFSPWPGLIAKKYNMVNVSFWTEPATVFSILLHIDLLRKNGHCPPSANVEDSLIDYIPGVDPIHTKDLMAYLQEADTNTLFHKIIFKLFEGVKEADFVLHNTLQELENNTLLALNQMLPTYAVGPINFGYDSAKINIYKSLLSEADCTEWLNSKPPGSVLYVSFGSIVPLNKQVIQEVAKGLHLSKFDFIWAIRLQIHEDETSILPMGFEDDVKDRGLIVPWCNQNAVLSHPAIGGFLTHCGWNSILESVWFGVPMICYPIYSEQPYNRKLVVDDWKIGINLCDGAAVNEEEVALKINLLMNGEASDCVRNETKKYKSILHNALAEGGSSERNFDRFLEDLKAKMLQRQQENA